MAPGAHASLRTAAWCCVYGVLGLPAPVHRCARSACTVSWAFRLLFTGVHALCACAVSWASRLLFTGVHASCVVARVRRPGPPGSRSPVCTLCVWCCVYGVLGLPARVHRCARPVRGVACAVWPFCACVVRVVLCVWCPGTLGSCSPVSRCVAVCVWCPVCGGACAVSWASRPLFTGARARCVAWCVRRGCGCVLACAIPLQHFSLHIASYGVLLILPVLDSLILATPKSKRVLMHAWRCMLFTRWFVDSLHFATPKSRRVCLMHSWHATYSLCLGLFVFCDAQE